MSGVLLGGCAGQGEQLSPKSQTESVISESAFLEQGASESVISEKEDSKKESSKKEDLEKEVIESIVPTILITQDVKQWYTDDGEVLFQANASKVEVAGNGFDALKKSLAAQWNGLEDKDYEELELAKDLYDAFKEEDNYFSHWGIYEDVTVERLDDHVISFCEYDSQYAGGSHGTYDRCGRTFDIASGRELQLEDILRRPEEFYVKAVDYILNQLERDYGEGLFADYEETVRTNTFGGTPASWYLDNTGIVIDYDLYLIAPYAAGMPSVTLPYDVFAEFIKEDYLNPGSSFIARVKDNEDFSELIGETGKVMIFTSEYSYKPPSEKVTVVSGDVSETVGTFGCLKGAYMYVIKREDGRSFLVFCCDYALDDFVTYVYEVTGGNVRQCDKLNGAVWNEACIGTDRIGLSMHLDVLGTDRGEMIYQLTDDGKLVQTEEIFAINTPQKLTVIKDLPVTIGGEKTTIPVGSKIRITGTDNAGKAYFEMDTDTRETGMIQYERDEQWQILIDGVSENAYFEMVPYAG